LLALLLLLPSFGGFAAFGASAAERSVCAQSAQQTAAAPAADFGETVKSFFQSVLDWIVSMWNRFISLFTGRKEVAPNTMNQNAIHMLQSVTDTIGDSFIITTQDGKVIVIDGGMYSETDYFLKYLKAVTGREKPHIDAWFLSHAHDDHCEVFLDVAEHYSDLVTFDKVYANFPEASFYEGRDDWAFTILGEYYRLLPGFADKAVSLREGDVLKIGAATFTVFYTFNPAWTNCNEGSTIMRMDLGGTGVMFTGDAGENAGNYVVDKYANSGLLDCDYCKMAHHGQDGVGRNFYEAVSPEVCLWPTPTWVWDNTPGSLKTAEVRAWMDDLGVKKNIKAFEGSQVIGMKQRIVTTTDVFEAGYPAEKAVDRLAALGYEGIDMGFDYWVYDETSPFLGDGYLDWAKGLKARAEEKGVVYTHAHAPGRTDSGDVIGRSIEAAAALGARYLVVHPTWQDKNGRDIRTKARFLSINAKEIKKWLPKAEACGVVLLSENVLWGPSADPRNIAALVQKVDSDWFGWCFDVGHAWCSGYGPEILKQCAVVPLSLHIQDNDGSGDGHLIPGDGTIDWAVFTKTLREIGYLGDCVMEAHHQSLVAPDAERDAILSRLLDVSKQLRSEMEA
jgi:sugar phosphate isomerase/epimerase/beta-lactamase superfamily II metal-dependent hydrolase